MTKAQEVYEKIEAMIASGEVKKADAFKTLAEQYGQPVDSLRGAYYQHKRVLDNGGSSPYRQRWRDSSHQATRDDQRDSSRVGDHDTQASNRKYRR